MFQYILYGIPTCDTTNAALKWLKEHAVDFHFHNLKNEDVAIEKLQAWCKQVGWKKLLNKQSMTFRSLHPVLKLNATNELKAIEIMQARPITIKRPILEYKDRIIYVGYDERNYEIEFESN